MVSHTKKIISVLLIILVCSGLVGCGTLTEVPQAPTPTPIPTPAPEPGITMENYDRIELGMTYDEVVEIFGKKEDSIVEYPFAESPHISLDWYNPDFMGTGPYSPNKFYWIDDNGNVYATDSYIENATAYFGIGYGFENNPDTWTNLTVEFSGDNTDSGVASKRVNRGH